MNFFRKLRKTNVTVLDNTTTASAGQSVETVANSSGRSSSGLRRSGAISANNGYHDSETKLFEEAPISRADSKSIKTVQLPDDVYPQNDSLSMAVSMQPDILDNEAAYSNQSHLNLNSNYNLQSSPKPQSSENVPEENKTISDDSKVNRLMTLYAAIIRGEKSEVKKLLTSYPDLLEAPDNFGRTPLMYCVLADRLECAKLLLKMKCKLDQVDKAGRSALHLAAHKASYKFLELLHDRGGNISMKDNDGQTPLHLTTRNRHARCLDFLLKRLSPGMVDVTDSQNRTALHWSAAFNNADYVKQLIKHDSNIIMPDAEGKTPLHWAANTHDPSAVETFKAILDFASSVLNWQDYHGRTALHFAVAHENVPAVEYLLKFEQETCEVDRLDNSFRTPLHWAAQLGNTDIVTLLLSVNAKNSITDSNGATALLYAALNNHSEVILVMIKHDLSILEQADIEGRSALMWAAGKGATDVIQTLLKLTDPNAAVEKRHSDETQEFLKETCESLAKNSKLKQAVDVNRTDNKGNTALHMAAWNGHAHSSELLLRNHARHDLQNNMRHTPLFGACEKGHANVVKHLLDYGASIELADHEERSPLHWAALGGHAEVCDLLIKKGLDPDLRDSFQRSPLHCAAFGGFINCMNLLLENRANVDLQDKEGLSALHWAAQSGHMDATKLLFQCSAFPNLMEFTEERLTPLDHALLNERDDVAQYLIEQGALSSETIRDIAAARIQACYRGHQVRKAFLRRKNLLMKHEMLRHKNKGKRKPNNADSTDHLNFVAEELVPKSPNGDSTFADSLYSADDSHPDPSEYLFPAHTIKSSNSATRPVEPKSPKSKSGDEESDSPPTRGQRSEDSPKPRQVPLIQITRHASPDPTDEAPAESDEPPTNPVIPPQNPEPSRNKTDQSNRDSDPAKSWRSPESEPSSDDQLITDGHLSTQLPEAKQDPSKPGTLEPEGETTPPGGELLPQGAKDHILSKENQGNVVDECKVQETRDLGLEPVEKAELQEKSNSSSAGEELKTEQKNANVPETRDLTSETSAGSKDKTDEVDLPPVEAKKQSKSSKKKSKKRSKAPASDEKRSLTSDGDSKRFEAKTEDSSCGESNSSTAASFYLDAPPSKSEKIAEKQNVEDVTLSKDSSNALPKQESSRNVGEIRLDANSEPFDAKRKELDATRKEIDANQKHLEAKRKKNDGKREMIDVSRKNSGENPTTFEDASNVILKVEIKATTALHDESNNLPKTEIPKNEPRKSKQKKKKEPKKKKLRPSQNAAEEKEAEVPLESSQVERIESEVVHGMAYRSSYVNPDDDPVDVLTLSLASQSDLVFSEYIESLMSLTMSERRALAALQRSRKEAFKKANLAAITIQSAWRRYSRLKYPERRDKKSKKKSKGAKNSAPQPTIKGPETNENHQNTTKRPNTRNHPDPAHHKSPKTPPEPEKNVKTYRVVRSGTSKTSTNSVDLGASSRDSPEAATPQQPTFSVKVSRRSPRRPRTSQAVAGFGDDQTTETEKRRDEGPLLPFPPEINSVLAPKPDVRKSRRVRPKTEHHSRERKSKAASLPQNHYYDPHSNKLEELYKIYGQTLALHNLYYPTERNQSRTRFRAVPAPSTRPRTSRVFPARASRKLTDDDFGLVGAVNLFDPVTAVQSDSTRDWTSSSAKPRVKKTGSLRHSKAKRDHHRSSNRKTNYKESEVASMPVQWQQIYSELKRGPVRRLDATAPTRFSYNMSSDDY